MGSLEASSKPIRLHDRRGEDPPPSLDHGDLIHADYNLEEEYGWFLEGVFKYVEDNPDDFLEHFGVKGMKWGVRNSDKSGQRVITGIGPDKITRTTANGDELTLTKDPPGAIARGLARISPKYLDRANRFASLTIRDKDGKKVGDASVHKESEDELNLVWLGIDRSQRGKGYATAAMKVAADYGREAGFKKLTLEVPGNAPDALHIYSKLGFKETGAKLGDDDDVWGGLTVMEYVFDPIKHLDLEDFLAHFGVKGMKWGVHNGEVGANASRRERKVAKKQSKMAYKAWKKEVGGEEVVNKIFQDATKSFNRDVSIINNDPLFKGKDLTKDRRLRRQYDKAVSDQFNTRLAEESVARTLTNTGRAMIYQFDSSVGMMRGTESQLVYHADDDALPEFIAEMDELGHVISLRKAPTEDDLAQAEEMAEDILAHYGIKGMKWGVRNRIDTATGRVKQELKERTSTETTVRAKPGQIVRVVGGNKRTPHADAVNARVSEQIAKRSTLDALSNKDLQHLVNRMNLEAQYRNLAVKETRKSAAQRWVEQTVAEKGGLLYSKLGAHAKIGQKVIEGALKIVTQNKAMQGGIVSDKNKNK